MNKLLSITTIENGKKWNRLVQDLSSFERVEQAKSATPKERFDYYIKQSFIVGAPYLPGVYLNQSSSKNFGFWDKKNTRYYDRYFSPSLSIEETLSEDIQSSYDNGKGSEFKSGKYYSVASSSRFATASFSKNNGGVVSLVEEISINGKREKCEVSLEEDLHVYSTARQEEISSPQMDVVVETTKDIYFIEVKCHEIFDSHKSLELKWKYMDAKVLQDLLHLSRNSYNFKEITKEEDGKKVDYIGVNGQLLTSKDFGCELKTHHFDFKQFLCHLMGICDYCSSTEKRVHFYYLFYRNDQYIKAESSRVYTELEEELATIFNHFRKLYPTIDFGAMYNNKFDTIDTITQQIG